MMNSLKYRFLIKALAFYQPMVMWRSWQREKEEEEGRWQCLSKREFCGMTWLEARVVKMNMMFHQSGSYRDICLSKQAVGQFKHHRSKHSGDDSEVDSHNSWRIKPHPGLWYHFLSAVSLYSSTLALDWNTQNKWLLCWFNSAVQSEVEWAVFIITFLLIEHCSWAGHRIEARLTM